MGTTTPDGLRYPSDFNLPADVPADMQNLANDVQTALNTKPDSIPTNAAITVDTSWMAHNSGVYGPLTAFRMGAFVMARGLVTPKTGNFAVSDNVAYKIATIPAGYRPPSNLVVSTGASIYNNTTSNSQRTALQAIVASNGDLTFHSNMTGHLSSGTNWVSIAVAWMGA